MPRDGGGVMAWPAGTTAVTATTIESGKYNTFLADLLADLNAARPITAGGTGATSAAAALAALGGLASVLADTSPQLGGPLDPNGNWIGMDRGATIASAATMVIGTDGDAFHVSGVATITAMTVAADRFFVLRFNNVQTLVHGATLRLPGQANITTAPDDRAIFYSTATDDVLCLSYEKSANQRNWAKGADVASTAALTLGTDGNYFDITGTSAITSIGTLGVGTVVKLHFDAALTLTHNATDLILPGGANITTAAGDEAEFVEYAAGDWRCTNYQLASRPPNRSSSVIQSLYTDTSVGAAITGVIPVDNTIPQNTEGTEVFTQAITPSSTSNRVRVRFTCYGSKNTTTTRIVAALFKDSDADAIQAVVNDTYATAFGNLVVLEYEDSPATVSEVTYKIRVGVNSGTFYFLYEANGGQAFSSSGHATMIVEEIVP